jgi:uncharacterized membrane protein YbhN (UPF0104 family)
MTAGAPRVDGCEHERAEITRAGSAGRRWRRSTQIVVVAAIVAGAAAAVYAERAAWRGGVAGLAHVRVGWFVLGAAAEALSMVAFASLERGLLRLGESARSAFTLRSVLATAFRANAISVAVPVAGSAMATGYAYSEFRRRGAEPAQVSVALALSGVFSSVAFGVVAAAGAIITGNLAAAAIATISGTAAAVAAGAALLALRFPRSRARLERLTVVLLGAGKRIIRHPHGDPAALVAGLLARAGSVRLGRLAGWRAFGWALVNWTADVACLGCAVKAAGAPVPWRALLLVWSAGAGAACFSPVPGGLGAVEVVLIAALAAAGLPGPHAATAVVLYRLQSLKMLGTLAFLGHHRLAKPRAPGLT